MVPRRGEGLKESERSVQLVESADKEPFAPLGNETERMSAFLRRPWQDDREAFKA